MAHAPKNRCAITLTFLGVLLVIAACGDTWSLVRILDAVPPNGELTLEDVELSTLRDLDRVSGEVAVMRGDATLLSGAEIQKSDRGASRDALVEHAGPVHARWLMDGDVVVPADFDSLVMFTAYAHIEKATTFFSSLGIEEGISKVPVFFEPELEDPRTMGLSSTDNAAFYARADAFILLPMVILQEIPFGMNPGVIAHEYSHRIWYYTVWSASMFAALELLESDGWTTSEQGAWNRLRATDEGVADFFASVLTLDPNFLAKSVPADIAQPRDLRVARALEHAWIDGLAPLDRNGNFDAYGPGAVVAATLWAFGDITSAHDVATAVIDGLGNIAVNPSRGLAYEYGQLEAHVIATLPESSHDDLCQRAHEAYAPVWTPFMAVCP